MNGPYSTTARNKAYAKAMSPDGRASPRPGAARHADDSPFDGHEWVRKEKAEKRIKEREDSLEEERMRVAKLLNDIYDIRENLDTVDAGIGLAKWSSPMVKRAMNEALDTCEEALAEDGADG